MTLRSVNPATGTTTRTFDEMSDAEIREILGKADAAFPEWSRRSFADRAACMRRAAARLRADADDCARLMAEEMGKPLPQGRAEVEKCAWACEHYAQNAERYLAPDAVKTDGDESFVAFRPLGPVLAVMPWNFPFWQVFRFLAPNLMAGNVGLLKHASNVQGCALAIRSILERAGFPRGVFGVLAIGGARVADVIRRPEVRAVTLTGSTPAGRSVAEVAGSALKKTVLELGGSDPYLVLDDADLERTVESCVTARLINTGQSCIAAKRFIVVRSLAGAFTERFVETMRRKRVGSPLDTEDLDLGPLARSDLRDELHSQVERSARAGAEVVLGGRLPEGDGAFYPPTVLTGVEKGMPVYEEETFGPVAAIIPAADEDEAVRIANDTSFGLGAAIFTRDTARGKRIATERLEAGSCFVNEFVKSDPRLPFGGIKESGYGRELGVFGIREFVNIKTVYVRK
jgi:succinate-semialdehyde dehydrogenase/glutarate-semialdehyde dehydrogenase